MLNFKSWTFAAPLSALLACSAISADAAEASGLAEKGKPDIKAVGPLAFGPNGVLFVGDPKTATLFAIGVEAASAIPAAAEIKLEGIDRTIASLLGTSASEIIINDLAVQPGTSDVFLSVTRGKGPDALPAIVRVDGAGKVSEVALDKVEYAKVSLNNAPAADAKDRRGNSLRTESITDLAYSDGRVFVAGLSNEEFASKLRAIPFPFQDATAGTSVEIYHGAHGAFETRSPVRTFVPFDIGGKPHILAAYTCTPLVKFPLSELKPGEKVRGITVAELGNRNKPLDLIVYQKDGRSHLLLANSARGVLKVSTDNIDKEEPITAPVKDTAGLHQESIAHLKGVEQLDKLNDKQAVILVHNEAGFNLESIPLP
ncbi:MAG: hypothetical protein V4719_31520 [Planctomycetota bacterium]